MTSNTSFTRLTGLAGRDAPPAWMAAPVLAMPADAVPADIVPPAPVPAPLPAVIAVEAPKLASRHTATWPSGEGAVRPWNMRAWE